MELSKTIKYQASQKFQFISSLLYTIVGILIAIIIGTIYAIVSFYSPVIILDIGLIFVLVMTLMFITHKLTRLAASRNTIVNMVMAFFICLFAYYANLVTFEFLFFFQSYELSAEDWFTFFTRPFELFYFMWDFILPNREITITKGSSRNGISISGILLGLVYLAELGAYFYSVILARKVDYFCEDCRKWYDNFNFYSVSDENLITAIELSQTGSYNNALSEVDFHKTYDSIIPLIDPELKSVDILYYQYCQCPSCHQHSIINIAKKSLVKEKKKFVKKELPKGSLVSDTYIDNATDQFFTIQKNKTY